MSQNPWDPEQTVELEQAKYLIEQQFPSFAPLSIKSLGQGWDNTVYEVNKKAIFRFPRRTIAVGLLENELRLLPALYPWLPQPIPLPRWHGQPTEDFPWPFAGYEFVPGETACRMDLNEQERHQAAPHIAQFLKQLHTFDLQRARELGAKEDDIKRLELRERLPEIQKNLAYAEENGLKPSVDKINAILLYSLEHASQHTQVLAHGDCYARHLMFSEDRQFCGVIDWGDIHINDPAVDLMIAHVFLPHTSHALFREIYGDIHEGSWHLARARGIHSSAAIIRYGHDVNEPALIREGLKGLSFVEQQPEFVSF